MSFSELYRWVTSVLNDPTGNVKAECLRLFDFICEELLDCLHKLEESVLGPRQILLLLEALHFGFVILLEDDRNHFGSSELATYAFTFASGPRTSFCAAPAST